MSPMQTPTMMSASASPIDDVSERERRRGSVLRGWSDGPRGEEWRSGPVWSRPRSHRRVRSSTARYHPDSVNGVRVASMQSRVLRPVTIPTRGGCRRFWDAPSPNGGWVTSRLRLGPAWSRVACEGPGSRTAVGPGSLASRHALVIRDCLRDVSKTTASTPSLVGVAPSTSRCPPRRARGPGILLRPGFVLSPRPAPSPSALVCQTPGRPA